MSTLLLNLPNILVLDFRGILSGISALFIIIGMIGIIRLTRWGLYFLAFSLALPIIFIPFQLTTQLIMLVSFINLVIFIDILVIYKAHTCNDIELQKKLVKISKKYISYVLIVVLAIFLAVAATVLSCAFGHAKAGAITKALGLEKIVNEVQEMRNADTPL